MELLSAGKEAPGGSSGDMDRFRHNTLSYQGIVSLLSSASSIKRVLLKAKHFVVLCFLILQEFPVGLIDDEEMRGYLENGMSRYQRHRNFSRNLIF